ncbi:hypothetical protein C8R21_1842 [Nitrosospira multiformis]|uniref:Uncharacterized protein n=1 Tax=Nitrosospira multiformis TaxID=1231 RepID=A0A2T5HVA1_9PROT|nr:hypothetical protein C8R21_1842 [Nitrosospira multiformis]
MVSVAFSAAIPEKVKSSRITADASLCPFLQNCSISLNTLLFPELFGPTKTVTGVVFIHVAEVPDARPNLSLNVEINLIPTRCYRHDDTDRMIHIFHILE